MQASPALWPVPQPAVPAPSVELCCLPSATSARSGSLYISMGSPNYEKPPPVLLPHELPVSAMDKGKAKADDHAAAVAAEPDQEEEFFSESESGSESIEIADLKKRMRKDQMLLMKLEGRSGRDSGDAQRTTEGSELGQAQAEEPPEARYRRKAMLRAQDGVLRQMLKMMETCNARGFVYGIVDEAGVPVSGSSDSLRGWWKDDVGFERAGPLSLVGGDGRVAICSPRSPPSSFLHGLLDIQDSTLGSLLSALIQHCEPPQRSFPLDRGLPPPWWPTGDEPWWGLQGETQAQQGPPPYRKPRDLKKAWKISLLSAVIKHLSPRFNQMRRVVWQSKRLQHRMSARDAETWSRVITQEEALNRQVQRSLQITPLEDEEEDDDEQAAGEGPREAGRGLHVEKRKREAGSETVGGNVDGGGGGGELVALALPDIDGVPEADRNSIDELMKLYYSCLQGTDDGGEQEMKDVAAVGRGGREQGGAVAETTAPDATTAHGNTDMLEDFLGVADVVGISDFPSSPIWHWGSSDLD